MTPDDRVLIEDHGLPLISIGARPAPALPIDDLARGRRLDGLVHRFAAGGTCTGCEQLWPCQSILAYADELARRVARDQDDSAAAIAAWDTLEDPDVVVDDLIADRWLVVLTAAALAFTIYPGSLIEYAIGLIVGGLLVWIWTRP